MQFWTDRGLVKEIVMMFWRTIIENHCDLCWWERLCIACDLWRICSYTELKAERGRLDTCFESWRVYSNSDWAFLLKENLNSNFILRFVANLEVNSVGKQISFSPWPWYWFTETKNDATIMKEKKRGFQNSVSFARMFRVMGFGGKREGLIF